MDARADRFPLVDALRAIAAFMVLGFHASIAFEGADWDWLVPLLRQLGMGVSVFFVISGFLLYRPFVVAHARGDAFPRIGAYAWRRFLRIVPAYWVALTAVVLFTSRPDAFPGGPLRFYLFGQVYSSETVFKGLDPAWTLCLEVLFYALLPFIALAARRLPVFRDAPLRREVAVVAAVALVSVAYKLWYVSWGELIDPSEAAWQFALPRWLDQFALGMGLAVATVAARERGGLRRFLQPFERRPSLAWLLAAVGLYLLVDVVPRTGLPPGQDAPGPDATNPLAFLVGHWLTALIAVLIVLPAVLGPAERRGLRSVLAWRPLAYAGLVSYGIYLYHYAVVERTPNPALPLVPSQLEPFLWLAAAMAGATIVASFSYYVVERPALKLKDRFGGSGVRRPEAIAEPAPVTPPR